MFQSSIIHAPPSMSKGSSYQRFKSIFHILFKYFSMIIMHFLYLLVFVAAVVHISYSTIFIIFNNLSLF